MKAHANLRPRLDSQSLDLNESRLWRLSNVRKLLNVKLFRVMLHKSVDSNEVVIIVILFGLKMVMLS